MEIKFNISSPWQYVLVILGGVTFVKNLSSATPCNPSEEKLSIDAINFCSNIKNLFCFSLAECLFDLL